MSAKNIRVLVVDDSAVIRHMISEYIDAAPGLEVAGKAYDGADALEKMERLKPDVVTLDIEMPRMNGLETLDAILERDPVPVIMVSSLTQNGAAVTFDALERGAMDYVTKPASASEVEAALRDHLVHKIRSMAGTDVRRMLKIRGDRKLRMAEKKRLRKEKPPEARKPEPSEENAWVDKCIAIGISTGGPPALSGLFSTLAPPMPPIVVVQHMPPNFTKAFAWRLNSQSELTIKEAETGDVLTPDHVYIAPGGTHLHLRRVNDKVKVRIRDGEPVNGHRPSIDVMMQCAADIYGNRCLGVIMTGMGRDGSDGCGHIRAAGGYVLGQDEASSDVYGMNKVALVEGNIDRQFALEDTVAEFRRQMNELWNQQTASAS